MATLDLVQTDDSATHGVIQACAPAAGGVSGIPMDRAALDGGTAGSTAVIVRSDKNSLRRAIHLESGALSSSSWASGNWTIPVWVSTGQASVDFEEVYVCRVNASGVSQATVGSLTLIAEAAGSGLHTFVVSGAAQPTANTTDRAYIVILLKNNTAHTNLDIEVVPSQTITTPVEGGPSIPALLCVNGAVKQYVDESPNFPLCLDPDGSIHAYSDPSGKNPLVVDNGNIRVLAPGETLVH